MNKCKDCGAEMNEGEASVFTICDACWDKVFPEKKEQEPIGFIIENYVNSKWVIDRNRKLYESEKRAKEAMESINSYLNKIVFKSSGRSVKDFLSRITPLYTKGGENG